MAVRGCADGGVRGAKLPRSSNAELEPAVAVRRSTALHSPTAADGRPVGVGAEPGATQRQDAAVSEPIQATAAAKRAYAADKAEVGRLAAAAKKDARAEAACGKAAKRADAADKAEVRRLAAAAKKKVGAEVACEKAAKSIQRWAGQDLLRTVYFPLVELCVRGQELSEPSSAAVASVDAQIDRNLAAIKAKDEDSFRRLIKACSNVTDALSTHWAGDALRPTAFP